MTKRPYTGWDGDAKGKRAGLEKLVDLLEDRFGLWNNGTWGPRNMRTKVSPSVHGTGRAADLSWRDMGNKGTGRYSDAKAMMDFLTENADELQIEAIFDYWNEAGPYGRGYKSDRDEWRIYNGRVIAGVPGDWVHIEISNKYADDPDYYEQFFASAQTPEVKPEPEDKPLPYPGTPVRRGSRGKVVKIVQEQVGAYVDGIFGPKTEQSVKDWQSRHVDPVRNRPLYVDGIVGPVTWRTMFQ